MMDSLLQNDGQLGSIQDENRINFGSSKP